MSNFKFRTFVVAFSLVVVLAGCGITAPVNNDGFADLEPLQGDHVTTTMMLSVGPTLLRVAARYVDDDPETEALLRALEGVRVRIYEIKGGAGEVAADFDRMSAKLRSGDWEPVVLVKEADERTHMLMKLDAETITGLTVLTSDGHEAVVVNVMGELEPEMFSETMSLLDVSTPAIEVPPGQ